MCNEVDKKSKIRFMEITMLFLLFFISCKANKPKEIEGMVYIPAGEFTIGSNDKDINSLAKEYGSRQGEYFENEKPMHKVTFKGFYIDKFEVTNQKYKLFVDNSKYQAPGHWQQRQYEPGTAELPVVGVTWFDAEAYCKWANKRLPDEKEWEIASKGPNGKIFPWGNIYDESKGNLNTGKTTAVGAMKNDKSDYGIYDMGGNVMEWTASWYKPYEGSTFTSKEFGEKNRVIKGAYGNVTGHYSMSNFFSRGSFRNFFKPEGKGRDVGFRCAKDG